MVAALAPVAADLGTTVYELRFQGRPYLYVGQATH